MSIRLIATDVDGTLIDSPENICVSDKNKAAICAAVKKGVTVCIASGRSYPLVLDYCIESGANGPVIGNNGADVRDHKQVYYKRSLPQQVLRPALEFGKNTGLCPLFFVDELIYFPTLGDSRTDDSFLEQISFEPKYAKFFKSVCGDTELERLLRQPVCKILFAGVDAKTAGNGRARWDALTAANDIPAGTQTTCSFWNNFEVMPTGVHKGAGLTALAESLGISMAEVMAVGDNENDIEMLQAAGVGVAMGNAHDNVKAAANWVSASVKADGLAAAIDKFVL